MILSKCRTRTEKYMKENQRIALTRRLLRDALLELLREMPLEKISVCALCRKAGINRTTFYHHYQTPNDVLAAMESEIIRELQQLNTPTVTPQDTQRTMVEICTYLQEHADMLRILFRCNVDAHLATVISGLNQSLWKIRDTLPHSRSWDDDTLQLAATFLGSGGYYLIRQWLLEEIDKTPEEVASLVFGLISK